jgi:hypothetical protein
LLPHHALHARHDSWQGVGWHHWHHLGRQRVGNLNTLEFTGDELAGDGELIDVHLAIAIDISHTPLDKIKIEWSFFDKCNILTKLEQGPWEVAQIEA